MYYVGCTLKHHTPILNKLRTIRTARSSSTIHQFHGEIPRKMTVSQGVRFLHGETSKISRVCHLNRIHSKPWFPWVSHGFHMDFTWVSHVLWWSPVTFHDELATAAQRPPQATAGREVVLPLHPWTVRRRGRMNILPSIAFICMCIYIYTWSYDIYFLIIRYIYIIWYLDDFILNLY